MNTPSRKALFPPPSRAPARDLSQCWSCGAEIDTNDDADVCVDCGDRNRRNRRHDDLDTRKAVAVVGAFLLGISVGLLAMRAALDWGWLS